MNDDEVELPSGWKKAFSRSQQRTYFYHEVSGKSVWKIEDLPNLQHLIEKEEELKRQQEKEEDADPNNNKRSELDHAESESNAKRPRVDVIASSTEDGPLDSVPISSKAAMDPDTKETEPKVRQTDTRRVEEQKRKQKQKQKQHTPAQDRRYQLLYEQIDRRSQEKAASFLRKHEGDGRSKDANELAVADEIRSLRSWVGEIKRTSDGSKQCTYYQDRRKKYPFKTSEDGYKLLQKLLDSNEAILRENMRLIMAQGDPQYVMAFGEALYEVKPCLKAYGETWSQEEYGHPGFQRIYIKLKSFQRFTETWATLERCFADGLFDIHVDEARKAAQSACEAPIIRMASIGGGPAFELLAIKLYFERIAPGAILELISLDLQPSWKQYVELLGFKFIHWNIYDGNLLETLNLEPGQLTYVVISYVLIYCTDDQTMDMLTSLLRDDKVRAIIVSERSESTGGVQMMESRGITVAKLMNQTWGKDERQTVFLMDKYLMNSTSGKETRRSNPIFPNVPFSEHKEARQKGGHKLSWRPFHDSSHRSDKSQNPRYNPFNFNRDDNQSGHHNPFN
mmetsp:Transcript_25548/g.31418  ORF Transcript_25548/g.31418 Transcript_25548/m.31418 type:complete len:565 (-) Transcript_25548:452-2146(-)